MHDRLRSGHGPLDAVLGGLAAMRSATPRISGFSEVRSKLAAERDHGAVDRRMPAGAP